MIPFLGTALLLATQAADSAVLARIRDEGLHHSRVMETALGLTDLNGSRLAGSTGYRRAAEWARKRMEDWGLASASLERWGSHAPSWELERFSVEMTAPHYLRIAAFPKAWSPATAGVISAAPVLTEIRGDSDFVRYHGKLRGRIVMNGGLLPLQGRESSVFHRLTDRELDSLARLTDPGEPRDYWEDSGDYAAGIAARRRIRAFYRTEGVLALLEPSRSETVMGASGDDGYGTAFNRGVPAFTVGRQHWNQLVRLVEGRQSVRITLSLRARLVPGDTIGYNVVAELPGSDPSLAPEVIMLGGHLDSWAAGTGATDNAAGCAIIMEALRILHAADARPRRTVRVALWDGEESGEEYMGSMGYVRRHFGDPVTMRLRPEHTLLSAYFNVDNGGGRLRGVYLQGNSAARELFTRYLVPVADLGAGTVSLANTGSTDHMSFVSVGLPGFQFITDDLDYETRTHHTDFDVADYFIEDDLKQAAVVVATVAYQTAMADAKVPRPPLPAPHR
jgi:carboxypeptidase Q